MITLGEYAEYLRISASRCDMMLMVVVGEVVASSVIRARSYIGVQQDDWEPLSDATIEGFRHSNGMWIEGKRALGYGAAPDFDPLLRTGEIRDSIEGETDGLFGIIGSADQIALYQEMGTPEAEYPIPPRPFLAKALMEAVPEIEVLCEDLAVRLLVPGRL